MKKIVYLSLSLVVAFFLFSNVSFAEDHNLNQEPYPNPDFNVIDKILTEKALELNVPPEIIKAIAFQESKWEQFVNGQPNISADGGIGIMQVSDARFDEEKLKFDIEYNVETAIKILLEKKSWSGDLLPQINNGSFEVIDHWYFAVMAYNGLVHSNSPIESATGDRNLSAYQEEIFKKISDYNNGMLFSAIPIDVDDLIYKDNNQLGFNTLSFSETSNLQSSRYFVKEDDLVITTTTPNLRTSPTTALGDTNRIKRLKKGEILRVLESFSYDESHLHGVENPQNHYVWYHVSLADGTKGYVAAGTVNQVAVSLVQLDELADVNETKFTDIEGHWALNNIIKLNKKDIIRGYTIETFQPNKNITRGEVMTIVSRLLTDIPEVNGDWIFEDAVPQDWAKKPIVTGVSLGLIQGYPNNMFGTNDEINRAELVVILNRLVNLVNYQHPDELKPAVEFTDYIPVWAREAVTNISQLGIVEGYDDQTFGSSKSATRAEVAAVISRILGEE